MAREDIRRFSLDTAIPVCIANEHLPKTDDKRIKDILNDPTGYPQLKDVFLGNGRVQALGGQHRKSAVTTLTTQAQSWLDNAAQQRLSQALADEALAKKALGQSEASNSSSATISDSERGFFDARSKTTSVKNRIQYYKTLLELRGLWLIAIYTDGEAIPTQFNSFVHS